MSLYEEKKPHSQDFFGEYRDFWWNQDFIELMAKRWNLDKVNSVLDVGCGIGHWGRVLSPFLSRTCVISGIDMESESIHNAIQITKKYELEKRFRYSVGLAEQIPFSDNTFDMVTCQTVLIHVKDVIKVLKEMKRVLKPGGILLAAEPNNSASNLIENSLSFDDPIEIKLKRIQFALICEKRKSILGLGHNSIGELIPGYFSELKLSDIKVYQSDKASPLIPPYHTEEEKVYLKQFSEWIDKDFLMWSYEETKKYFLAGGGILNDFNSNWENLRKSSLDFISEIQNNRIHSTGGVVFYLISGRKILN
jgi:SAM-dependent methyltransferase